MINTEILILSAVTGGLLSLGGYFAKKKMDLLGGLTPEPYNAVKLVTTVLWAAAFSTAAYIGVKDPELATAIGGLVWIGKTYIFQWSASEELIKLYAKLQPKKTS